MPETVSQTLEKSQTGFSNSNRPNVGALLLAGILTLEKHTNDEKKGQQ